MKPATTPEPSRAEIEQVPGTLLLEFGASWCGFCQRAQPLLNTALQAHPKLRHERIEDGPGKRLGRSFRIKLWPTLILLHNGVEIGRVVRPESVETITTLLQAPLSPD